MADRLDQLTRERRMNMNLKRLGPLFAAAVLAAFSPGEARAQFGLGGFGDPFMFFNFNNVPSSTQFLYDRSNAQISQATAARESAMSRASMIRNSPNAYWNNVRDLSGGSTYDVSSRRSLSSRAADVPPLRSPAQAPPAAPPRVVQPLASFFKGDGPLDWPRDAPDDGVIGSDRREAEVAITAVRDQIKSGGKAGAQAVGRAKSKLIGYGQQALARSRAERAPAMAEVFHYFLLILNDSLGEAGG